MAAYELLLLNTAIPQIQAAQSGDTYVVPRDIAFSTVANLANGTNLLPSLTFSSDTNTGIYREGADALGFTAGGGTNQMVLTSTGLGIGTNNPAVKLDTQAAVTGTYNSTTQQIVARFFNSPADLGSGVNSAFITLQTTPDGGNSNPVARVGVVAESYGSNNGAFVVATRNASGVSEKARITSGGALLVGKTTTTLNNTTGTDISGGFIATHSSSGNGTIELGATRSAVAANIGGIVSFRAVYRNSDADSTNIANIKGYRENATDNNWSSYLAFETTNGSTLAERARISSDGTFRVKGAGTAGSTDAVQFSGSAPASAMTLDASGNLLVGATSANSFRFKAVGTGGNLSGNAYFVGLFGDGSASGKGVGLGYDNSSQTGIVYGETASAASNLAFWTYSGSAWGERARITSGGNVEIGTSGDAARLRVLSTASQSNGFYVTHPTALQDVISCENSATSGDNIFISFYTDTQLKRGDITYNRAGGLVAYNTTSDYRAKDIIGPIQNVGATIDALKVYEGKMKGATQSRPMLVAHEAQEHAPYAVTGEKDAVNEDGTPNYQRMDVSSLVPLLLAEIQSLRARVAQLEQGA